MECEYKTQNLLFLSFKNINFSGKPGDVTGTGGNYGSIAPGVRPMDDNRRKFFFCKLNFILLFFFFKWVQH